MVFFLIILLLLCLYKIKFATKECGGYYSDYMSIDKTNSIKGIFILIVFMAHFCDYVVFVNSFDVAFEFILDLIGQRMVTLFMFYSGWGVMESIKKKNIPYIKKIPINRVLNVLFRFDIALLFFVLINVIINKGTFTYSIKTFLLSLIGWESIGNSNWYIFAILVAYLATYFGFMIFKDKSKYKFSFVMTTVFILAYFFILRYTNVKNVTIWYDTILCYPLGMIISIYKEKFTKVFNNKYVYIVSLIVILFVQAMSYKFSNIFVLRVFAMLSFALLVVLITMKISIDNKYLRWCGKHLFSIYILQRLPMIIFDKMGIAQINLYLYFLLCLVATLLLAYVYEKYIGMLWKKIVKC